MNPPITVIHHSADFDGLFCREIARRFLPGAKLIGWDFADAPLAIPPEGRIYILDLPADRVFGFHFAETPVIPFALSRVVWIDHHRSSIESHPRELPGYRVDGVAACRLAWQWFMRKANEASPEEFALPGLEDFVERRIIEPPAVQLAGEYDVWDKRNPQAETFQHGLRGTDLTREVWEELLVAGPTAAGPAYSMESLMAIFRNGQILQRAQEAADASVIAANGFTLIWEGLKWLACNHARFNSHLFTAGLRPEHEACMGFRWTGRAWVVSLYHVPGREDLDLSAIALKYGGGGHRGACGFSAGNLIGIVWGANTEDKEDKV